MLEVLSDTESNLSGLNLHKEWSGALKDLERSATVVPTTESAAPSLSVRQLVRMSSDPGEDGPSSCGLVCTNVVWYLGFGFRVEG